MNHATKDTRVEPTPGSGAFPIGVLPGQDATAELYLGHMLKLDASELYVTAGLPAVFRVQGENLKATVVHTAEWMEAMIAGMLTPPQLDAFKAARELTAVIASAGARFRVSFFMQKGTWAFVARRIRTAIPTLAKLGLPPAIAALALARRGLILVAGGRGTGKTTTVASMVDHRNSLQSGHIVVIDEAGEFVHSHKTSIVSHREIGVDALSYADAMRNVLAQSPDLVVVGEIRDRETMEAAFAVVDAGRLCIATVPANDAFEAIDRVLDLFDESSHADVRLRLSRSLRAVVGHRMVPATNADRVVALEIMVSKPRVRDLLKRGDMAGVRAEMEQLDEEGSCTFDASLLELVAAGRVLDTEALAAADNAGDLRSKIERRRGGAAAPRFAGARPAASPAAPAPGAARGASPVAATFEFQPAQTPSRARAPSVPQDDDLASILPRF